MIDTTGSLLVSEDAKRFQPLTEVSLALRATDTVGAVLVLQDCANAVIGMSMRPAAQEEE